MDTASDVDSPTLTWNAVLQVSTEEESLTLDLPEWMDRWDARDQFHRECMDVYGDRGVILALEQA